MVTTRTMPSLPGWTLVTTAVGHWSGVVLCSLSRTWTPGWWLGFVFIQRGRCCRLWRLSADQRCQNSCSCCWKDCHLESLLHLKLLRSAAGNCVIGSPIRKCPQDRYVVLKVSSDRAHRGLEFRQASISVSRVTVPHRRKYEHSMFVVDISRVDCCLL